MHLILIPGLWLDGAVWGATAEHLRKLGHQVDALTLPGQGDGNMDATYDDQVSAVLAAVDRADERPYVVGHSAAATLAWVAADARADKIAGVAFIGGFPEPDGQTYAAFFPFEDGVMRFPGWEPFEGPDADDLDAELRQHIAAGAVGVPEAVATGTVRLHNEDRYNVPATLVCPEFTPEDARGWLAGGDLPELAAIANLTLVNIDSGHWPMFSCPDRLAEVLAQAAEAASNHGPGTQTDG